MRTLTPVGFIFVLVGMTFYFFTSTVSEWTAVGYFRLFGRKLDYNSVLKNYAVAGILLMIIGIIVGILGFLVNL